MSPSVPVSMHVGSSPSRYPNVRSRRRAEPVAALPSRRTIAAAQLAACYAVALFHRTCGAVLLFPLAASFDVAPHALNGIAIVFFWVYALLQLPSGVLADVLGSRRLAMAGCVAMGAGALAFGLSNEVWIAVSARGVIAAGCAVIFVLMVRYVKANWTPDRVATMTGRGIFVGNVGTFASAAPLALLLLFVDWRTLSLVFGAMSLVLALGLWFSAAEANEPYIGRARLRMVLPQIRDVLGTAPTTAGSSCWEALQGRTGPSSRSGCCRCSCPGAYPRAPRCGMSPR